LVRLGGAPLIHVARPGAPPFARHHWIDGGRPSDADAVISHLVDISGNLQEFVGNLKAENFP
jgi:hypothetical protein